MSRLFYCSPQSALLERGTKTFPPVEHQFRIITTALCNKVQKQLNVSADAKSFSPMFNLCSSVNTSVALEHFNFGFLQFRSFQMHNRRSSPFWNLDLYSYRNFASSTIY